MKINFNNLSSKLQEAISFGMLDESNFPYGKPSKYLKKACKFLREELCNIPIFSISGDIREFDMGYYDMPENIFSGLSSDDVDWIQDELNSFFNICI